MALPIPEKAPSTPLDSAAQSVAATAQAGSTIQQPTYSSGVPSLLIRPSDQFNQLPDEPWEYSLQNGVRAGLQYSDQQNVPGTFEYRARDNDQFAAANAWLYNDVASSMSQSRVLKEGGLTGRETGGFDVPKIASREAYFSTILKKLPPSEQNERGVANYIAFNGGKEAETNARYLFKYVGPYLKQKMDDGMKNWNFPDIINTAPEQLAELALRNGAKPEIVQEFLVSAKDESRSFYGTSIYNKMLPLIESLDPASNMGKLATLNPEKYLFSLPEGSFAEHQMFIAMAKWKREHGVRFIQGAKEAVGHLLHTVGYGTVGILQGAGGALVSGITAGNVNIENGDTYLSNAVINGDQQKRKDIQRTLEKSEQYIKLYGPQIRDSLGTGKDGDFAAVMNHFFGQYADPDAIQTFKDLSRYKAEGAFRPGYAAEKLAAFGEGVLDAGPAMYRFFNDSIDMNSWSFNREVYAEVAHEQVAHDLKGNGPIETIVRGAGYVAGTLESIPVTTAGQWLQETDQYKNMNSTRLDASIRVWKKNYLAQTQGNISWVAEGYDAVGLDSVAKIARGQAQDTTMVQAGQLFTPDLVLGGVFKMTGITFGATSKATKALEAASAEYKTIADEVMYEVQSAQQAGGKPNQVLQTAIDTARKELESRYPKVKITDEQIVAIAMGQRGNGSIGRSAAGKIIRQQVGTAISGNDVLISKIKVLENTIDEAAAAAAAKETVPGGRPVGGRVTQGAGVAIEKTGEFAEFLGNEFDAASVAGSMDGASVRRKVWFGSLRAAGKWAGLGKADVGGIGVLGVGYGVKLALQGDAFGAILAGVGGIGIQQVLKPEFLKTIGTSTQQIGRITQAIGKAGIVGERQGQSLFLQAANNLEGEARAMGDVSTDAAKMTRKGQLAEDASKLRELWRKGYEDVMLNSARVIWEDGAIGGGTGAVIAHLADRDATGSGAGFGTMFSMTMRSVNTLYKITPHGAQPGAEFSIFTDLKTQLKDMPQSDKARIFEYLGDVKADRIGYVQRANIVRDLLVTNRGGVKFVNESEFAAMSVLGLSEEAEAALIIKESGVLFPGDPEKSAAYAARRQQQLKDQRAAKDKLTISSNNLSSQQAKLDTITKQLQDMRAKRPALEKAANEHKTTYVEKSVQEASQKALDDHLQVESNLEMQHTLINNEITLLKGDVARSSSEVANAVPFRPFEERVMPDGSTYKKVANGYYVETTPGREGHIVVDINNISNLEAISEGWHSLLNSDAAKTLMPEMIEMVWGDPTSGRRIMSDALREHFFDAYTNTLTPDQAARFKTEMSLAHKEWEANGKKDPTPLLRHTQELMTWYMSTIDMARRTGYRPGVSTPPGLGAPSPMGSIDAMKFFLGERGIRDATVVQDFKTLLDPDYGLFARSTGETIKLSLEKAGMRFIEASDGTLRGYFFNNKNEIVRSVALNSFYERVLDMTGGVGGKRLRPVNLYDTRLTPAERVDFVKAHGMDWVLNEAGTDILPPDQVSIKSTQISNTIRDTLAGVKDGGMKSVPNPNIPGEVIFTGIPTQADIDAIASNPGIHPTIRSNIVAIMDSLSKGVKKPVLVAQYNNVFSVNPEAITNARLYKGTDFDTHSSTKHFVPLSLEFGFADVVDAAGKPIKVVNEKGEKVTLRQATTRVNVFNPQNFEIQKNRGFTEGLVTRDKDGNKTGYLKSPDGKEYTAAYLKELWIDDASLMRDANIWINHLHNAGHQDPFSPTPTVQPSEPSANILSPDNLIEGEAKRDALRILFGTETADFKKSWVYGNRPGANTKFAIRGSEFPLEKLRVDAMGQATTRGDSFFISQDAVSSAQLALAPASWKETNYPTKKAEIDRGGMVSNVRVKITTKLGEYSDDVKKQQTFDIVSKYVHPYEKDVIIYKATNVTRETYRNGDRKGQYYERVSESNYWIYSTDGGETFEYAGLANQKDIHSSTPTRIKEDTKLGAVIERVKAKAKLKDDQAWTDYTLAEYRKQEAGEEPKQKEKLPFTSDPINISIAKTLANEAKNNKGFLFGDSGRRAILDVSEVAQRSGVDIRKVTTFYRRLVSDGILIPITKDKVRTENGSFTTEYKLAKGVKQEDVVKRINEISTRDAAKADAAAVPKGMSPENPLFTKKDYKEIQEARDKDAYDLRYEATGVHTDPALIAEEKARLRRDTVVSAQQAVLSHIHKLELDKITQSLIERGFTEEAAAAEVAQRASDEGWALYSDKIGAKLDKARTAAEEAALKKWYEFKKAEVRAQWAWEEAAILKVEKERLEAHREEQRRIAAQEKRTEAEQRAYEKKMKQFDAELIARNRAVRDMVDSVIGQQALSAFKVEKLHAQFIASGEPVITPGLLVLDPNLNFYRPQRVTSGRATTEGKPYITHRYEAVPLIQIPAGGGRAIFPYGTKATDAPLAASVEAGFNSNQIGTSNASAAARFYSGTTDAAVALENVTQKKWVSEGNTMLVAEIRKTKDMSNGANTLYKVYGVSGNSLYIGNNATDALRALKENDDRTKNNQSVRPSGLSAMAESIADYAEAAAMNPKSATKTNVNKKEFENQGFADRYNKPRR